MYNRFIRFLVLWLCLASVACASYQSKVEKSRELIKAGQFTEASAELKPLAEKEGDDQLVYLFDYGTALQIAGEYQESNAPLLQANELAKVQDYHSLTRITGSLLLSERMIQYKGEDYENILVNAMLAVNFLMLGDKDAALVETRRINEKLDLYITDAELDYQKNPFAYYLSAMIWESDKKWDDAYIDYKKAYDLRPDLPLLKEDLVRVARKARRYKDLKKWKKDFQISEKPEWKNKEYGELILIHQQGWAPRKLPNPEFVRVPKLYPVDSFTQGAQLVVNNEVKAKSQVVDSVEVLAMETLGEYLDELVAKRIAAIAAKAVVADQVRQKNEALGSIAWVAMNIADRADLRQWSTLPESFQVARVFLKAGTYKVRVEGLTASGGGSEESLPEQELEIVAGKKTFLNWRSVQ